MTGDVKKAWTPAGVYKGLFDGYVITANRHFSLDGETAWHIRMYLNSGDTNHRAYWVVGDDFQNSLKQTVDDSGSFTVETGGSISNLDEKAAIVKAIAKWETVIPE
jgi:2-polyprenyl-6-methoxyphenol hydroxylase-like FAD-dependent oxidoreductase